MKALIVGDTILDEFLPCDSIGLAQEGPFCTINGSAGVYIRGGANLVFRNLKALSGSQDAVLLETNHSASATKTRYCHNGSILLRVNHNTKFARKELQQQLEQKLLRNIHDYDVVILSDYGLGTVSKRVLQISLGARHVILDPHPTRIPYDVRVSTYMPNRLEWKLDTEPEADLILVTQDRDGVWSPTLQKKWKAKIQAHQTVIGAGGAFCAAYAYASVLLGGSHNEWVQFALDYVALAMQSAYVCVPESNSLKEFRREHKI